MISNEEIIKAYATIRKIDCSIPDDVLDFMKDKAIDALQSRSCTKRISWGYANKKAMVENCNFGLISHDYDPNTFYCNRYKDKGVMK